MRPSFQAARSALEALGSDLPKLEFVDLLAGFELFTRVGTALPEDTIECVVYEFTRKEGGRIRTYLLTGLATGPCGNKIARCSVLSGWLRTLKTSPKAWLTALRNSVHLRKGYSDTRHQSSLSAKSSTFMPIYGLSYPCAFFEPEIPTTIADVSTSLLGLERPSQKARRRSRRRQREH